jgi:hypothetical protein
MPVREAVGLRVLADARDTQRLGAVDQDAEDAAPARQVANAAVRLGVDAARDEALELAAVTIEDSERRIARACDLACRLEDLVEHRLRIELGEEPTTYIDQATQSLLVEMVVHGSRLLPTRGGA